MKKQHIGSILTALFISAIGIFAIGCTTPAAQTAEYSVTVLSPDKEPMSGIAVYWDRDGKHDGTARTDDSGKATATLPLGTYTIEVAAGAEYTYTPIEVGSSLRDVTFTLKYEQVEYTATVLDKNGAAASGVTVTWTKNDEAAGSAKTDATGKATIKLNYGEYSVTVSNLPEGNIYGGDRKTVDGTNPTATFELNAGDTLQYTIKVRSAGGLIFKNCQINVYKDDELYVIGRTDDNGVYTTTLEKGNYTATVAKPDDGYVSGTATLSTTVLSADVILTSSVITAEPPAGTRYLMGDIIHDYTFATPYNVNGKPITVTISELLKTKKAVIINNWGTQCSNCLAEMPAMEEAYQKYKDDIEIIAISNYPSQAGYDSDQTIINYYNRYKYTFPMMRDSGAGFTQKFGITGWPTTVVIDRYGAIARIEIGAITDSDIWGRLIQKYIGDDYVQTFVPGSEASDSITTEIQRPDVTVPEDHYEKIGELLNKFNQNSGASVTWYPETEYEYAWPFIMGTVEDISPTEQVVYASGTGHANSMSVLYATVNVQAGKVFTFDYYCDSETNNDVLNVLWDGRILEKLSGLGKGWQTCRLFAEITAGAHSFAFVYAKNESRDVGTDNVYIKNVRFTELDEITADTNMLRAAAYGTPAENATEYPYYAEVALADDGYYHVNLNTLQSNSTLDNGVAGNDGSPMLFVNLLGVTNWSSYPVISLITGVDEDGQLLDLNFEVNGETKDRREELAEYITLSGKSDLYGYLPIDKDLHDLLVAFTKHLSGKSTHTNEWLELCYFYSHYGSGDPIGNPIIGLTEKTAVNIDGSSIQNAHDKVTTTADLTRIIQPLTYMTYTFTPAVSGVYRMHSLIPEDQAHTYMSQIWLYDEHTSSEAPLAYCGDDYYTRTGEDEHNFDLYYYMTAGKKYYVSVAYQMGLNGASFDFDISLEGDSVTVLSPASAQYYTFVIDGNGNITSQLELGNAVDYERDDDGYYRAVNADGSRGSFIYLDVRALVMGSLHTLSEMTDTYVQDPATFKNLEYKMFDFTKRVIYVITTDNEGNEIYNYDPNYDMTRFNEEGEAPIYTDYTARLKEIIASGDENGLVKVDDEIVQILTMYYVMRNNSAYLNTTTNKLEMEEALENEWLRFCLYYKTYENA